MKSDRETRGERPGRLRLRGSDDELAPVRDATRAATLTLHGARRLSAWTGATALTVAMLVSSCAMTPIGSARRTLEGVARISSQLDADLARQRRTVSAEIIADPSATRDDHARAMAPYDEALVITEALREAQLAVEAELDAAEAGRDRDWTRSLGCMADAFARLVIIAARVVDVPNEAAALITTLSSLAAVSCRSTDTRSIEP